MKTREIEVWLCEGWEKKSYPEFCLAYDNSAECTIKARLIVEAPDKKIEITESQFDEAFDSVVDPGYDGADIKGELKQKLFGE